MRPSSRNKGIAVFADGCGCEFDSQILNTKIKKTAEMADFYFGVPGGIARRFAPRPADRLRRRSPDGSPNSILLFGREFDSQILNTKIKKTAEMADFYFGVPGENRTHSLKFRKLALYPVELRGRPCISYPINIRKNQVLCSTTFSFRGRRKIKNGTRRLRFLIL